MNVPIKKQIHYLLLLGTMLFSSAALFGQSGTVSGKVTDINGEPIIGANIVLEGTTQGTVSDIDGNFTLPNLPAGSVTITVSFVGYLPESRTFELAEGGSSTLDFTIVEDLQQLSEVVVIGYGTMKKSDLTGAVTSVNTEELQKLPSTNVSSMMQGMAAGVQVLNNSGQPGSEPVIRVRGLATINGGSPLIVIDGIQGGDLQDLNPNDIESIEVLKDAASQSIYGSAGGNGVILVTTKKGSAGKIKVNFDMYVGMQKPWRTDVGIADAQEYAKLHNLSLVTQGTEPHFPEEGGVYLNPDDNTQLQTTPWTEEIFRTGLAQNYNLSLSGGNKVAKFFAAYNYNNTEGTVHKTFNKRHTVRLNSEFKVANRVTFGESFNLSMSDLANQGERNEYGSPLATSIQMLPFIPIKTSDGSGNYEYRYAGRSSNVTNPLAQIEYNNNINSTLAINGNVYGRVEIIKGLTFESRFGIDHKPTEYRQYQPAFDIGPADAPNPSQSNPNASYTYNETLRQGWKWQNFFNYSFTLAEDNNFTVTAGFESGFSTYEFTNRLQSFHPDSLLWNEDEWQDYDQANELEQTQPRKYTETAGYAYFARLNYDYKGIVLLQGNFRRDYSSKFGANQRVGNFPSVSVGLKFSEFEFIQNLNVIDFGKIRVGYGETGNSDIQPNQDLSLIGELPMHAYPFGGTIVPGAGLITLGNSDLSWETVVTKNIGADFRFLSNRLSFSVDVFDRQNQDMLLRKSLPDYVGLKVTDPANELGDAQIETRPLVNYGTLSNKGFEISLSYKHKVGDFNYEVFGNITKAKTTIESAGDPLYEGSGRGVSNVCRTIEGGPVSAFYGYKTNGIYTEEEFEWYLLNGARWRRVAPNDMGATVVSGTLPDGTEVTYNTYSTSALPGDYKYIDIDEDGQINTNDIVQIGDPNPDFTYGFGLNFGYKNFDLNLFFQGSYGNDVFNLLKINSYNMDNGGLNIAAKLKDGYVPAVYDASNVSALPVQVTPAANTSSSMKRLGGTMVASDVMVEDGSYMRLKNAQLGYTFSAATLEKMHIDKFRIYVGGTNLLTFTKYEGFDPEVNETSILERGFDRATYPQAKMYTLGINLIF